MAGPWLGQGAPRGAGLCWGFICRLPHTRTAPPLCPLRSYKDGDSKAGKNFRRRFRMPWKMFDQACAEVKEKGWWPVGGADCAGRPAAPMELLVLGVFRMLGRACTFDDLEELSDISAETHRR